MNIHNKLWQLVLLLLTGTALSAAAQTENILPAETSSVFHEYTLANGLQIFVLEDFSSAVVRIEYTVRAGYSAQTPKTAGFFPLYVKLFPTSGKQTFTVLNQMESPSVWYPDTMSSECTADSARFIMSVTPSQTEQALSQLSCCAFSPVFNDTDLKTQLSALKTEVMQYAFSTAGFINSSIDSRVFSEAPWKQDSGIYPAIFTAMTPEESRTILTAISKNRYTPQNSALFISGGISAARVLQLVKKYFTAETVLPSGAPSDDGLFRILPSGQRKFVLSDKLITADMTQIVVQFTSLSAVQTDISAAAFDADSSSLKKKLLAEKYLSIRGEEYISAAAVHKNGSSRLIFQSLLEKNKTSPVVQAEAFTDCIKNAADTCTPEEFEKAKSKLSGQYQTRFRSSASFMDMLSQFWALCIQTKPEKTTIPAALLSHPSEIRNENTGQLVKTFDAETPFVFVLVNSDVYTKYAADFKEAGYEQVTAKNGSWYTQELYAKIKKGPDMTAAAANQPEQMQTEQNEPDYCERNRADIGSLILGNGIPVVLRRNPLSSTAVIAFSISGGELSTAPDNPGLEEVLVNALAENIQSSIAEAERSGTVSGNPEILAETGLADSTITVECLSDDIGTCIDCISKAIIYGSIKPSSADGLIFRRQEQQRIQSGNTEYQLYSRAIRLLYADSPYSSIFNAGNDILAQLRYSEIPAAYTAFLDAAEYSIVLCGNIPAEEKIRPLLENTFGILARQTGASRKKVSFTRPVFPQNGRKKIPLQHLFLTDTSADKAGPRPEVLVPTKNFSDPVQYWLPSPEPSEPDFVRFNALMTELENRIKKNQDMQNANDVVHISGATDSIQAAVITFSSVDHTDETDELYRTCVKNLIQDLSAGNQKQAETVSSIKNGWIQETLSDTQTNRGTALLLCSGLRQRKPASQDSTKDSTSADIITAAAGRYLSDYGLINTSTAEDFFTTAIQWLPEIPPLRLYSADSKR